MTLYLVTDRGMLGGKELLRTVEEAVRGGVGMVQLREKECPTRDFVALARAMKAVLTRYNVPLLINDRVDVALAAGADGVHVGQSDMAVEDVRRLLSQGAIVGLSVESEAQLMAAGRLEVDYVALSPIFSTPTKEDTLIEWGLEGIRHAREVLRRPIAAIGGINRLNAAQIAAAGADYVCVVSAVCAPADPQRAAEELKALIG